MALGTIAAGVGLIGGLKNLFKSTPEVQIPNLEMLRSHNPELYAEFMATLKESRMLSDMASRREGLSSAQQIAHQDVQSQTNQQLANRGLTGSSTGNALSADARSRSMANFLEVALKEKLALMQGAQQARGQAGNIFNQGVAPISQALNTNQRNQMAADAGMNQFLSGLFTGGMGLMADNPSGNEWDGNMSWLFGGENNQPSQGQTSSFNMPAPRPQPYKPNSLEVPYMYRNGTSRVP